MPHPWRRPLARFVLSLAALLLAAPAIPAQPAAADFYQALPQTGPGYSWWTGMAWWEWSCDPSGAQRIAVGKPAQALLRIRYVSTAAPTTAPNDGRAPLTRTDQPAGDPRRPAVEALGLVGLVALAGIATALPIVALEPSLARRRSRLSQLADPGESDPGW